jgi:hypothetical protein
MAQVAALDYLSRLAEGDGEPRLIANHYSPSEHLIRAHFPRGHWSLNESRAQEVIDGLHDTPSFEFKVDCDRWLVGDAKPPKPREIYLQVHGAVVVAYFSDTKKPANSWFVPPGFPAKGIGETICAWLDETGFDVDAQTVKSFLFLPDYIAKRGG